MGHPSENSVIDLKEAAAGNYEHFTLKVSQTGYFGHYILHGQDTKLHIADKNFKDRQKKKKRSAMRCPFYFINESAVQGDMYTALHGAKHQVLPKLL